jgi:hypothetical protein
VKANHPSEQAVSKLRQRFESAKEKSWLDSPTQGHLNRTSVEPRGKEVQESTRAASSSFEDPERAEALATLRRLAREQTLTLLSATKNTEIS